MNNLPCSTTFAIIIAASPQKTESGETSAASFSGGARPAVTSLPSTYLAQATSPLPAGNNEYSAVLRPTLST